MWQKNGEYTYEIVYQRAERGKRADTKRVG